MVNVRQEAPGASALEQEGPLRQDGPPDRIRRFKIPKVIYVDEIRYLRIHDVTAHIAQNIAEKL